MSLLTQGIGLRPSALGSILPARWAGEAADHVPGKMSAYLRFWRTAGSALVEVVSAGAGAAEMDGGLVEEKLDALPSRVASALLGDYRSPGLA